MTRCSNQTKAGGRSGVRRLPVSALITVGVLLLPGYIVAAGEQEQPEVTVSESAGTYSVEARFTVAHPVSAALAVLTDYEQIPRFVPDVRRSTVLDRSDGQAVVEQEANPRFMMFSRRVHLVLDVTEDGTTIRFRDRCGRSFSEYEGSWDIRDQAGGAAIVYQLRAKPSFAVPEFVLKRLLKRDAVQMIDRLRGEIAARAKK